VSGGYAAKTDCRLGGEIHPRPSARHWISEEDSKQNPPSKAVFLFSRTFLNIQHYFFIVYCFSTGERMAYTMTVPENYG
jgi:hypothetical protein